MVVVNGGSFLVKYGVDAECIFSTDDTCSNMVERNGDPKVNALRCLG